MKDFIKLYDKYCFKFKFTLEIYNSQIMDYCLNIKCGGKEIINIQSCDFNLMFAKAYVELADWLSENNNGY